MRSLLLFLLLTACSNREVKDRAQDFPEGQVLLIGDSIAAASNIEALCGKRVFNAAIGGTGVQEWSVLAPELIQELRPTLVVVALGIVDARRGTDPERWASEYRDLISTAGTVALVSISPVDHAKITERRFSDDAIAVLNDELRQVALERGAKVAPPVAAPMTTDGIHLSPEGNREWTRNLSSVC